MADLQRVDDMKTPPIVGVDYLVPCVEVTPDDVENNGCRHMTPGWWPVLGPEHEDGEFFNFSTPHWHFDSRFLSPEQLGNRLSWSSGRADNILTYPLSNVFGALRPPQLKRKRCCRETFKWVRSLPGLAKLERVLKAHGRMLKGPCKVCPHQGFPLASLPVEADGGVTCPGHGLRWHAETGALLPRSSCQPVRTESLRPWKGRTSYEDPWTQAEEEKAWRREMCRLIGGSDVNEANAAIQSVARGCPK